MARGVHFSVPMDAAAIAAIDVAEAAYDLQRSTEAWLPNLLERGAPLFDRGLGCAAAIWAGRSPDRQPLMAQVCAGAGSPDLRVKLAWAAKDVGPDLQRGSVPRTSGARTSSESEPEGPDLLRAFRKRVGCRDVLGVWAMDPRLHGVGIQVPSAQFISLSQRARRRWQRLAVHIEAGHRLRRRLGCAGDLEATPVSELPLDGDALIDPTRFVITHAKGDAQRKDAMEVLRDAAIRADQARGKLRREDADKALEIWQDLVRGYWSLVDWFDTDGRRYIVVVPNALGLRDPRGLTERERQVATLAARGETSKSITYSLGISRQRVSMLLHSAMYKLGVKTQPELVMKMRGFHPSAADAA
jgi:DNA-binding CsgD family transcriptional regulator